MIAADGRYRAAARAYFAYGVVYLVGGGYLLVQGVGIAGDLPVWRRTLYQALWIAIGASVMVLIPFLLRRRRAWFERWVLSRRDFARLLSAFMAYRALHVALVAVRSEGASVPAPWGGVITFQAGAVVFFFVTVTALAFVGAAAWQDERAWEGR